MAGSFTINGLLVFNLLVDRHLQPIRHGGRNRHDSLLATILSFIQEDLSPAWGQAKRRNTKLRRACTLRFLKWGFRLPCVSAFGFRHGNTLDLREFKLARFARINQRRSYFVLSQPRDSVECQCEATKT